MPAVMAFEINSNKTADQISSRYYTLTRKPKNGNQANSNRNDLKSIGTSSNPHLAPISHMNDTSTFDTSSDGTVFSVPQASVDIDESTTVDTNEFLHMDGTLNEEQSTDRYDAPIDRINESTVNGVNHFSLIIWRAPVCCLHLIENVIFRCLEKLFEVLLLLSTTRIRKIHLKPHLPVP